MLCEVCGQKEAVARVSIEGTILSCCAACGGLGKKLAEAPRPAPRKPARPAAPEESIIEGFGPAIKRARERKSLTHEQLALAISEKASLLRHLETEHQEPPIALARKLERFLGIALVEISSQEQHSSSKTSSNSLTIGDTIRIRKR